MNSSKPQHSKDVISMMASQGSSSSTKPSSAPSSSSSASASSPTSSPTNKPTRKEIYTYTAPWDIFGLAWSNQRTPSSSSSSSSSSNPNSSSSKDQKEDEDSSSSDRIRSSSFQSSEGKSDSEDNPNNTNSQDSFNGEFKIAIGSFMEEYTNKVRVVKREPNNHSTDGGFFEVTEFDHPYPVTKLLWSPQGEVSNNRELIATTGDYLRIWGVTDLEGGSANANPSNSGGENSTAAKPHHTSVCKMEHLLNNNKNSEYCAPLTSFDWNETDPSIIGTSSIDTTCTIWDINTCQAKTQLIAHDKEVYDIAFAKGTNIFASVGADGSVRLFDLRCLEHSTIIYESKNLMPLLRLAWNKQDPNYLATILSEGKETVILDIRVPSLPVAVLEGHNASVNAIAWAPHSSCHICTASDDSNALIWDLQHMPKPIDDPILAYDAKKEINNLQWSSSHPEWISIVMGNALQILRV